MRSNWCRIVLSIILVSSIVTTGIFATDVNASEEYIKFVTGSVADKTSVLLQLTITDETDALTAGLPEDALRFVADIVPVIGVADGLKELAAAAVPLVALDSAERADLLWSIFKLFDDDIIRTAVLSSFVVVIPDSRQLVVPYLPDLHTFVAESIASGTYSNLSCIQAVKLLGMIADTSSFDLLFRLVYGNYDVTLTEAAVSALDAVMPVAQTHLIRSMGKDSFSVAEKNLLFSLVQKNNKISTSLKAELAENALSSTIINTEDVSSATAAMVSLQVEAVREITRSSWTRASATIAKFFPLAQKEFEAGLLSELEFIEIVKCLETLATTQSVAALSDYLGTLNNLVATSGAYNEAVTIAVINALGALGDKSAFDNLLYVTYLPFSEPVVTAARTALAGLKW